MKAQLQTKTKSSTALKAKPPAKKRRQDAWQQWLETLEENGVDISTLAEDATGLTWLDDVTTTDEMFSHEHFVDAPPIEAQAVEDQVVENRTVTETAFEEQAVEENPFEEQEAQAIEAKQMASPQTEVASDTWIEPSAPNIATAEPVGDFVDTPSPLIANDSVSATPTAETEESLTDSAASSRFERKSQAITPPPESPPTGSPYSASEPSASYSTSFDSTSLDSLLSNTPTTALPFKSQLESRFGQSLDAIKVYIGTPEIRAILAHLDATAANYNHQVLFAEHQPSLETVIHEVIHALQTTNESPIPQTESSTPFPEPIAQSSPAEQEASQLTQDIATSFHAEAATEWSPVDVTERIHPTDIACLRNAPPATVSPTATPSETLEATAEASAKAEQPSAPTTTDSEREPTTDPELSDAQAATDSALDTKRSEIEESDLINAELETVPALEVPAPPEPGISAEDVAARQAELEAAQAELEGATDVDEKVEAYAKAPPTLKAKAYGSLGADLDSLAKADNKAFQEEMPDFEAKLSGETEELPELQVETPPGEESISLEDTPPAPAPDPTVDPTAAPKAYTENSSILKAISRFLDGNSPQDRASEIGDTLGAVKTTDNSVETSPGEAPAVPLEGETDPERIENQVNAGRDRSIKDRDEARQKVLDGPGPERIQPLVMEEKIPLEDLTQPELTQPEAVSGVDNFSQRELPPEVNTAFDLTHQETMQASMGEAQTEVQKATEQRDRERKEKVDTAQSEADQKTAAADKAQRNEVQTQREQIQTDRKTAIEQQNQAVKDVEGSAETRRKKDRDAIDSRVKEDQKTVSKDYAKAERDAKTEVKDGEKKAEDKRKKAERDADKESWWDRAVSFVKKAIQALTDAISKIFDAVRAAINKILDEVKKAALALIDKAANFIKKAISEFSDFLQDAVNGLLKEHFPAAAKFLTDAIQKTEKLATEAVDKVAEGLKKEITELIEGLRKGLNAIMDALQAGLKFVSTLIQAALSGDWGAVLRMMLEAVFKVIGVEPETFYAFIGKAEETFQQILDDPGAVVKNLLDSIKLGIQKFADNFLNHLKAGIIGWLTGALGSDLTIPTEFTLIGVLDLGRQIMGLTLQLIRKIAVRIIGEENVEKIESIFEEIKSLVEGGWAGLLEKITETLTGIKEMVLGQIKEFLVTRLILSAITKLASLFNPVGAIVQLVLTIWNIFTFLRDNLQRMIEVVKTIVASITEIFKGIVEAAAINIETVLANLLPIAISFLANLLGLGGISARVRKIISNLRKRIEDAIVKLIRKIAARFKKKGKSVGKKSKDSKDSQKSTNLKHQKMARQAAMELKKGDPKKNYEQIRSEKIELGKKLEKKYTRQLKKGIKMSISFRPIKEDMQDGDLDIHIKIAPNDEDLDVSVVRFLGNEIDTVTTPLVMEIKALVKAGAGERQIKKKISEMRRRIRRELGEQGANVKIDFVSAASPKAILIYRQVTKEVQASVTRWQTVDDSTERNIETWAKKNLGKARREQSKLAKHPNSRGNVPVERKPPVVISVNSPLKETPYSALKNAGYTDLANIIAKRADSGPTGKLQRPIKQVAEVVWLPSSVGGSRGNSITLVARLGAQEMYLLEGRSIVFDGGHQVALMFGGSDEPYNITPQNIKMNQTDFVAIEKAVHKKFIDYQNNQESIINNSRPQDRAKIKRLKMTYTVEAQYKPGDSLALRSNFLNQVLYDYLVRTGKRERAEELQRSEASRAAVVNIPRRVNKTNVVTTKIANIIQTPRNASGEENNLESATDQVIRDFVAEVHGRMYVENGNLLAFVLNPQTLKKWIQSRQIQERETIFYDVGKLDAILGERPLTLEQLLTELAQRRNPEDTTQRDSKLNLTYITENQKFVVSQFVSKNP